MNCCCVVGSGVVTATVALLAVPSGRTKSRQILTESLQWKDEKEAKAL